LPTRSLEMPWSEGTVDGKHRLASDSLRNTHGEMFNAAGMRITRSRPLAADPER